MQIKVNLQGGIADYKSQHRILKIIHQRLGENNLHDNISLYCFSSIWHNSHFFFSSFDASLIKKISESLNNDPVLFSGFKVSSIEMLHHEEKDIYRTYSPVFVKDRHNNHLVGKQAELTVNNFMKRKMQIAGIDDDFKISFNDTVKTKLISINNIQNRCFVSPVRIEGSKRAKEFICSVGIGHSTGCGFGFIR